LAREHGRYNVNDRIGRSSLFAAIALMVALPLALSQTLQWSFEPSIQWGDPAVTAERPGNPNAVVTDGTNVYWGDNDHIFTYGTDGSYVSRWGNSSWFTHINDFAFDNENIYIVDRGNDNSGQPGSSVDVYTRDGTKIWGIGTGTDVGVVKRPWGVAVDRDLIYVSERANDRVQVFFKTGGVARVWGETGTLGGQFDQPHDLDVQGNEVYVADNRNDRVQVFTKQGQYLREWYANGPEYIDATDHLVYVTCSRLLQVFDRFGRELWTQPGTPRVWTGIHADEENGILWLSEKTNPVRLERLFGPTYRTLGATNFNPVPLATVDWVSQRPGSSIVDVDYHVSDPNDPTVTTYAAAFIAGTNTALSLEDIAPMLTFVDGTGTNRGPGIATGILHRLSWDMSADGMEERIEDYGDLSIVVMASDGRGLIDLHFVTVPEVGGNLSFEINRTPLSEDDLMPAWFWLLASGDSALNLSSGKVFGVSAPYAGTLLAEGRTTTADGRGFICERLGVRTATAEEVQRAREGATPPSVAEWDPLRAPPAKGSKVNEINFVTFPTNGWWVVPTTP